MESSTSFKVANTALNCVAAISKLFRNVCVGAALTFHKVYSILPIRPLIAGDVSNSRFAKVASPFNCVFMSINFLSMAIISAGKLSNFCGVSFECSGSLSVVWRWVHRGAVLVVAMFV